MCGCKVAGKRSIFISIGASNLFFLWDRFSALTFRHEYVLLTGKNF